MKVVKLTLPIVESMPPLDEHSFKLLIQQMNTILRDSHGGGIMERFESISKLLFTKVVDEREAAGEWNGSLHKDARELQVFSLDTETDIYNRALSVWHRIVSAYPDVFSGDRASFPDDISAVARIIALLGSVNLNSLSIDIKGQVYEEVLRNTFEKNENQQFFTPRHIVDFVVRLCRPMPAERVCDPACGSGGFLVGALAYVRAAGGDTETFASGLRGAEVDGRMAWIARINMLMHGGDPRSICHLSGAGSLAPLPQLADALAPASFDLILTNPPFGSDLTDREALSCYEVGRGRPSRRRGVVFVERCLDLLKPGGRLAIVLDDSVLNLPSNGDIRELIRRKCVVQASISLPDVTFLPYSSAKSSVLLVKKRHRSERQGMVFMADVENVGTRPNGDPLLSDQYDASGRRALLTDLPLVLDAYHRFCSDRQTLGDLSSRLVFPADIDEYGREHDGSRLDAFFFHPARRLAQAQIGSSLFPLCRLGELLSIDSSAVQPSLEYADNTIRWIGLGEIEPLTGAYEVKEIPGDRIKSNAHIFQGGDVLFSRLRPKLRKVVLVPSGDEGGVCSSELLVLRAPPELETQLHPAYLAYVLRSDLVYGQLIYQVTGVGRPRVSATAVKQLLIPVPPLPIQREILGRLDDADAHARRYRAEAVGLEERAREEMVRAYESMLNELFPSAPGSWHPLGDNYRLRPPAPILQGADDE